MNSSPRDFFDSTLIGQCNAAAIIVGDDFRFGHRQQGSVATLREFAQKTGTLITAVNGLTVDQHSVKSSLIRRLIEESGDVSTAERLLGRYYAIEGDIVKGNQLGRKIGVPTANLNPVRQLIPQKGVYAGYVYIADSDCLDQPLMKVPKAAYPAVLSIGFRPTVSKDTQLSIEAHILQSTHEIGLDSLYGKKAAYYFSHRLRNEMRFHSIEELQHEMGNDIARAKRLLGLT